MQPREGAEQPATPPRARFAPGELRAVLQRYPLGAVHALRELIGGAPQSPKAVARTDAGTVVIKRRVGQGGREALEVTSRVQARAAEQGVPTPVVVRPIGQMNFVLVMGEHAYEVAGFVPGQAYRGDPRAAAAAGAALAKLHRIDLPHRERAALPTRDRATEDRVMAALDAMAHSNPALTGVAFELAAAWVWAEESMAAAGAPTGPIGVVHGDFHGGNTLYNGSTLAGVIDFDRAAVANQLDELASAAVWFSLESIGLSGQLRLPQEGSLRAFLRAYIVAAELTATNVGSLPARMTRTLVEHAAASTPAQRSTEMLARVAAVARWIRAHADETVRATLPVSR